MNKSDTVTELAAEIVAELQSRNLTLATAESCTGGSIAAAVTGVAGCSAVFKGGVVAYCNEVKASVLGVQMVTLEAYGAVSENTVREMVAGVQRLTGSDCAVATSGVAGPGGGSPEKPVGTVWVAVAVRDKVETSLLRLVDNGRVQNIENTVKEALGLLQKRLSEE